MTAPLVRILLRYLSGLLVMKGLISTGMGTELATDPDLMAILELVFGSAFAVAAEWWYVLAKRWGWSK
jgi:hypothetical protein